jgi:putative restriction endonuclease
MRSDAIRRRFDKLRTWSRRGERAPHKPLLLLLALGRLSQGETALPFVEYEGILTELLREFGPSRQTYHPEYPFWHLQNDDLWQVSRDAPLRSVPSGNTPTQAELRESHAIGSLPEDVQEQLLGDPSLLASVAQGLLSAHFPPSLHEDIRDAVGLPIDSGAPSRQPRDATFRKRILVAYEFRCALCGLDLRLGNVTMALEAAHIKWYQAGGPDVETNGIALCSLHHKVFDLGAFTIHTDYRVLISELAHGAGRFEEVLLHHHGRVVGLPSRPEHKPSREHLVWHRNEVFKEGPRYLDGVE